MSTHFKHYKSGKLYAICYHFDDAGDGIPPHDHGTELAHNIIVLNGRVRFTIEKETDLILEAGTVHDFDYTKRHKIVALESNTRVIHFLVNGMPKEYDRLPRSELSGSINFRELH